MCFSHAAPDWSWNVCGSLTWIAGSRGWLSSQPCVFKRQLLPSSVAVSDPTRVRWKLKASGVPGSEPPHCFSIFCWLKEVTRQGLGNKRRLSLRQAVKHSQPFSIYHNSLGQKPHGLDLAFPIPDTLFFLKQYWVNEVSMAQWGIPSLQNSEVNSLKFFFLISAIK